MRLTLRDPCIITPRLLPGVQVGDAFISIEYGDPTPDGRQGYRYHIDTEGYEYTGEDLASGVGGGALQGGLATLLSFLGAFAEACHYSQVLGRESENSDLFPVDLQEWAIQNSDEFGILAWELEETKDLIREG